MIDHSKVQATLRFCGVLFFLSSPVLALGPSNLASGPASQRGETAPVFSPLVIQNPGVVEISPEGFDRVLAISDIHGMYPQLLKLLKAAKLINVTGNSTSPFSWTGGKTLLVVIGDSIDKGPQSIEVLDLWMSLTPQAEKAQGRIVHLLGNHEAEFLADPAQNKSEAFRAELTQKGLSVDQITQPQYPRAQFLLSLPIAAKVGAWIFAHSGFYTHMKWTDFKNTASIFLNYPTLSTYQNSFFIGAWSILEAKKWEIKSIPRIGVEEALTASRLAGIVFGHQPKAFGIEGECGISSDRRLIKIDNGMAPEAGSHEGSILNFPNPSQLLSNHLNDLPKMTVNAILPTGFTQELKIEH